MHDFRYAFRQLCRTPGFTAAAVVTLALGLGASTTFFAVVNAMVLRPSTLASTEGLYSIRVYIKGPGYWSHGPLNDSQMRSLERRLPDGVAQLAAFVSSDIAGVQELTLHTPGRAERVKAEVVTGGYAPIFNLRPQPGRLLEASDDRPGAEPAVVISDRIWREWFGDDRQLSGRTTIRINGQPFTIVGVAPRGFRGALPPPLGSLDVWITTAGLRRLRSNPDAPLRHYWTTLVRLRPGVSVAAAEASIGAMLTADPETLPAGSSITALRLSAPEFGGELGTAGFALIGFATLVLVAACANLANMLLARGAVRSGEVAVRLSLGASRLQVFRLFFAETLVIAAASAALGILVSIAATSALNGAFPSFRSHSFRMAIDLSPDYRVFLYGLGAAIGSALAVGVITAWRASRVPVVKSIAASGIAPATTRGGRGLRLGMVAVQVTAAVFLLMSAGLYVQAARRVLDRYVSFDTDPLATAMIDLRLHGYHEARGRAFYDRVLRNVRAIPGVERAALTDGFPGGGYAAARTILAMAPKRSANETGVVRDIAGNTRRASAAYAGVSPGFLETIGLPLRHGRDILATDQETTEHVAVVSESAAAALWPEQEAIGQRFTIGNDRRQWTVVGVSVDPVRAVAESPLTSPSNLILLPAAQWYRPEMIVVIRSRAPAAHLEAIRSAVRAIDENVAATDVATANDSIMAWAAPMHAATILFASLGLLALAISTLGVYGVISYLVSQRTREFGIRMALGARPRQVVKLVLDEARVILLLGLLAGVFFTAAGERILQNRLFRFMPNEIITWAVVLLLILGVGMIAAFVPARRASRIDPNVALREL